MATSKKMTDLDKEHWAYVGRAITGDPQPEGRSLEESWRLGSDNMQTDWASELGYLMDNAADPTNERVNQAIANALIERMRKQKKLGQEIYDPTNARALRWLENAGYEIDGGTEFDMKPFSQIYDDTGNAQFGAGGSLMDQWNPEPERYGWNGGWVDQDENGNGGYYVPAGKYSEQEWEQALADAMLYGREGSGNMEFLRMRQERQQEPYDPDYAAYQASLSRRERIAQKNASVQPEQAAEEQTSLARNGTPNWTSYSNPNITTQGTARDEGYLPNSNPGGREFTEEERLAALNDPHHYNGYAGPVEGFGYDSNGNYVYKDGSNSGDSYLSALDALVRGSQATNGLKNSNAVTAGQRVLTSAEAPESEYEKYLRQVNDKRYKYITDKRKLY